MKSENGLLVADLHLTGVARDAYRWRLFPWLMEAIPAHAVAVLIILGDLTEAKDYHSSRLVNRIVDEFCKLHKQTGVRFVILPGNHDGIDPGCPYFRFLGQFPFIHYMQVPYLGDGTGYWGRKVLFLPHTREPKAWLDLDLLPHAELIFMHQTLTGAKSETGAGLEGMPASILAPARRAKIWSGDVHVPQVVGPVEYVGSPYPVRFGDSFNPRAVLLSDNLRKATDLETPYFGRHSIAIAPEETLEGLALREGDQAKFKVRMTRAEFVGWEKVKRRIMEFCEQQGVELCGLEVERVEEAAPRARERAGSAESVKPSQVLKAWCEARNVAKPLEEAGQKILSTVAR